jgi:hypothetical protein
LHSRIPSLLFFLHLEHGMCGLWQVPALYAPWAGVVVCGISHILDGCRGSILGGIILMVAVWGFIRYNFPPRYYRGTHSSGRDSSQHYTSCTKWFMLLPCRIHSVVIVEASLSVPFSPSFGNSPFHKLTQHITLYNVTCTWRGTRLVDINAQNTIKSTLRIAVTMLTAKVFITYKLNWLLLKLVQKPI